MFQHRAGVLCNFSIPVRYVALMAQPISDGKDLGHVDILYLNVQNHDYTFILQTHANGEIHTGQVITTVMIQGQSDQGQSANNQD
jgi:hypothetical protein